MSVILFMTAPVFAQFTLTQSSFPAIRSHNVGLTSGGVTFDVGSAGTNQIWTFGDYTWNFVITIELVDAATSPYFSNFPTSNYCEHTTGSVTPDGGFYNYYRMTDDGLRQLGLASTASVDVISVTGCNIAFPCSYQTNWSSVLRYTNAGIFFTDSTSYHVDGWGTLTTPYGSNSTLRVFLHTWFIQRYPPYSPDTTESVKYSWLTSQGEEMLRAFSNNYVTDPNFSTGSLEMTGVPMAAEPVRGPVAQKFVVGQNYPNPFNPTTMLPVDVAHDGRVTLDIYDETGRLVSHQDYVLSVGHHEFAVNGQNWATGAYFARIISAAQSQTVKMQLVR